MSKKLLYWEICWVKIKYTLSEFNLISHLNKRGRPKRSHIVMKDYENHISIELCIETPPSRNSTTIRRTIAHEAVPLGIIGARLRPLETPVNYRPLLKHRSLKGGPHLGPHYTKKQESLKYPMKRNSDWQLPHIFEAFSNLYQRTEKTFNSG